MGKFITGLILFLFGVAAVAGFRGETSTSNLGLLNIISCSTGINCTKSGAKMVIANANVGVAQSRVLATATTLTSAQCGSTIYNGGAIVINLPEASTVLGCRFTFITANASNFDINPDNADVILNSTNVAGDASRNATVGNSITLEALNAVNWAVVGINGTWSDAN